MLSVSLPFPPLIVVLAVRCAGFVSVIVSFWLCPANRLVPVPTVISRLLVFGMSGAGRGRVSILVLVSSTSFVSISVSVLVLVLVLVLLLVFVGGGGVMMGCGAVVGVYVLLASARLSVVGEVCVWVVLFWLNVVVMLLLVVWLVSLVFMSSSVVFVRVAFSLCVVVVPWLARSSAVSSSATVVSCIS